MPPTLLAALALTAALAVAPATPAVAAPAPVTAASAPSDEVAQVRIQPATAEVGDRVEVTATGLGDLTTVTFGMDATEGAAYSGAGVEPNGTSAQVPVTGGEAVATFTATEPGEYSLSVGTGSSNLAGGAVTVTASASSSSSSSPSSSSTPRPEEATEQPAETAEQPADAAAGLVYVFVAIAAVVAVVVLIIVIVVVGQRRRSKR